MGTSFPNYKSNYSLLKDLGGISVQLQLGLWGFPKIGVPFLGVPFRGLDSIGGIKGVPPMLGNILITLNPINPKPGPSTLNPKPYKP